MIDRIVVWALSLKARASEERGQDLLEYAMLGGLIVIGILAVVLAFTGALNNMITGIGNCIDFSAGTTCDNPF